MKRTVSSLEGMDPLFVKSLVKLFTGISVAFLLIGLIALLPGANHVIPSIPLTLDALIMSGFTVSLVGLLVLIAPRLESIVAREAGDPALGEPLGSIARYMVFFLAVIVAHRGLSLALGPALTAFGLTTIYEAIFVVLGTIPLAYLTYHLYRGLDPISVYLARTLMSTADPEIEDEIEFCTDSPSDTRLWDSRVINTLGERVDASTSVSLRDLSLPRRVPPEAENGDSGPETPVEEPPQEEPQVVDTVPPEFLSNEDRIFALLDQYEGKMRQTDVVKETGWSKSKVSRVLSQMEEDDQIVRVDIGRGNVVTRPDDLPAGAKAFLNR